MDINNKKIKEYSKKFPFGLEEFIQALSTETQLAIAYLLLKNGPLNYEEIIQYFHSKDRDKSISIKLKLMNYYGVTALTKVKVEKGRIKSKYKLNEIYKKLLINCIDVLEQRK